MTQIGLFRLPIWVILFSLLTFSCEKADSTFLAVETNDFSLSYDEANIQVKIISNSDWIVKKNVDWITLGSTTGHNTDSLRIKVEGNITSFTRSAIISIVGKTSTSTIRITQGPIEGIYQYRLPIVFHVLYSDATDQNQYPQKGRLAEIVKGVNRKLSESDLSVNMGVQLVMAEFNPTGVKLAEPGVERLKVDNGVINSDEFMGTNNSARVKLIWDPDKYINVMLYTFTNNNVLGVSHLPFSQSSNPLDGLYALNYRPKFENLAFPLCISLNNRYVYIQSDENTYYTTDVITTLTHELGHYLGLYHAFSESEDNSTLCLDSDYCEDTPTYNRELYNIWCKAYLDNYFATTSLGYLTNKEFSDLIEREDCTKGRFVSTNIMDYTYSMSNVFTSNQYTRVRHVLTYSPLIPGPKILTTTTRSTSGVQDLPIHVME